MKILTRILRTFWGLWHILWYALAILIFAPFHMLLAPLFGEKASRFLMFVTYRIGAPFILIPCLHRVKNHGKENIDLNRSYMVVGNHSSNLDFYLNPYSAPMYIRVLVKKELTKLPLFGSVMKAIAIPVDRQNKDSGRQGLEQLKEKLTEGYSAFIYPEGTRNRTQEPLLDFKNGAFRTAIECQVPVLVTTIANARKINDIRQSLPDCCPGTIHIYWEVPIETKGMTQDDVPRLKQMAREMMLKRLELHR